MFSRLASFVLASALSLAATAQDLPVLATASNGSTRQTELIEQLLAFDGADQPWSQDSASVVPIWSGTDGHLLALVAVPGSWGSPLLSGTTAEPGPASWYLLGETSATGGLRWQMNNGLHADVTIGRRQSALPALCGLACDTNNFRSGSTGSLGLGWMSPDGAMDLSYGLSWLQARTPGVQVFTSPGIDAPLLTLPGALSSGLESSTSLYARGRWKLDGDTAFDVGASYGHARSLPFGSLNSAAPGIDLDQLSLSLGMDAGSLRGAIVGHVLRSDDPALIGKKWTALDLGVSWRTPWRGEISVGAQNLWSAPLDTNRDTDSPQSLMPYIQYRQDL